MRRRWPAARVIAPGGGWAAQPGALEDGQGVALLMIYLKTHGATTAAKRAGGEGRPLLVGEDPVERMRQLLKEREPFYRQADAR